MNEKLKKEGWKESNYVEGKIINKDNTKSVTITSYGAIDSTGDKIFTKSEKSRVEWTSIRS